MNKLIAKSEYTYNNEDVGCWQRNCIGAGRSKSNIKQNLGKNNEKQLFTVEAVSPSDIWIAPGQLHSHLYPYQQYYVHRKPLEELTPKLSSISTSIQCHCPPGPQGPMGLPGPPGLSGVPGLKGEKGEPGENGIPGMQGSPGDKGFKGLKGAEGTMGEEGFEGRKGLKGFQGSEGSPGKIGQKGSTGIAGTSGPIGQPGPPGPPGPSSKRKSPELLNTVKISDDDGDDVEGSVPFLVDSLDNKTETRPFQPLYPSYILRDFGYFDIPKINKSYDNDPDSVVMENDNELLQVDQENGSQETESNYDSLYKFPEETKPNLADKSVEVVEFLDDYEDEENQERSAGSILENKRQRQIKCSVDNPFQTYLNYFLQK